MPDIVNEDDLSAFAAEYVIGTLDPNERTRANALLDVDEGFRGLVRAWERRLGELHLMVEPVEPDGRIWERIRGRLGVRLPADAPPPPVVQPPPFVQPPAFVQPPPFVQPAAVVQPPPFTQPVAEPVPAAELRPEPPPEPPPEPQPEALTTEQKLAGLIEEADRFSEPRPTETVPEPAATPVEPPAKAPSQAESLLSEAAEAIGPKLVPTPPAQPDEETRPEAANPAEAAEAEPWPSRDTAPRRDTMLLAPADLARAAAGQKPERPTRWRVAALLMTVVALGLGSLIAAWRFVPDRLPSQLQPLAVLGLSDPGQGERLPAEHGTQFEE